MLAVAVEGRASYVLRNDFAIPLGKGVTDVCPNLDLSSKCSATLSRIAAIPPGARQGFGGRNYPRYPTGGAGLGCDRALWWRGCSCDTPAAPSKLQKEPRQGCSYTLERDKGAGVASAPLLILCDRFASMARLCETIPKVRTSCRSKVPQKWFFMFLAIRIQKSRTAIHEWRRLRKTREGWNCRFRKTPRRQGWEKVAAVWTQGSRQVCFSRRPKS